MNRVKVWIFTLVVVVGGAAVLRLHAGRLREEALQGLDGRLLAGSGHAAAAMRATLRETAAAAALSASDSTLRMLLSKKEEASPPKKARLRTPAPTPPVDPAVADSDLQAASDAALASAEAAMGAPLPVGREVLAGNEESLSRRPVGGEADSLVRGAAKGTSRIALVRSEGKLWAAAGVPAGPDAGVAVLAPLGEAWVRGVATGAGVDVTIAGAEIKPTGTAHASDAGAITAAATKSAGTAVEVGNLVPVDVFTRWIPVIPKLGPLFDHMPGYRARATPVEGLKNVSAVVSVSTASVLAPVVALQWRGLVLLAAVLLLGIFFGLLVRPSEIVPAVPEELVAAAAKIERGDFEVRAPQFVGKLGTIASALNRAAAAAATPRAATTGPTEKESTSTHEFYASQLPPPPKDAEPFEFQSRPTRTRSAEPEGAPATRLTGDPFQAAAVAPSSNAASQASEIPPVRGSATIAAVPAPSTQPSETDSAAPLSQAPSPSATSAAPPVQQRPEPSIPNARATMTMPAAVATDELTHWQQVFEDFMRTRNECGETTEGLTFDRFRAKLESNKATLIAKYGCKTVRFQAYVKEGKAALKATPVR